MWFLENERVVYRTAEILPGVLYGMTCASATCVGALSVLCIAEAPAMTARLSTTMVKN